MVRGRKPDLDPNESEPATTSATIATTRSVRSMSEDNFIDFKCPYCEADASFPEPFAGTAQDCPNCLESLVVPKASTPVGGRLPLPIRTARLALRRLKPDDWKDLLDLMSREELFRYEEGHTLDEPGVLRWLETDRTARLTHAGQSFFLGVELQEKARLIGFVSITCHDEAHLQAGLTVTIHPQFQRQGYGTEAVGGVLGFCLEGIHVHRLTATCDSRNLACCRMLEKAGMRREGEFLEDRFVNGAWVSTAYYALLREEYEKWPRT